MKQTPRIILICEGGMIQQVISNTKVEVVNLDYDIMECDMEEPQYYEDRVIHDVDVYTGEEFDKIEAECIEEWNTDMDKHPSFINDEDK